jgi:hypothetical protein
MRSPIGLALSLLLSFACASTAARAQTPDDAFYDWDLETYRLLRAPDDPTGAILPLPTPATGTEGASPFYSSMQIETADITQPQVTEDESNGLRFPDGARLNYGTGGIIPLPASFRVQLGGRFMSEKRRKIRGEWLDRSAYWIHDHVEIRAGLTRSFWGDGNEGSLLLGRTAPPLEMIRVRTVHPVMIPGLRGAGRFHGSTFLAYLDDGARTIPDPLLQGARVEWEPSGWARFSLARTILLGGAGRTQKMKLGDVWNILLARNENRKDARDYRDSDQIASLGAELRLPQGLRSSTAGWIDGGRAFYEYGGEDGFHGLLPRAPAHLYGLSLASHGWIALAEGSDTMNRANHWYTHWTYGDQAYFYRGYPLGHPMGSLASSRHVEIWTPTWDNVRARAWWRLRSHEPDSPDVSHREGSVGIGLRHDLESGKMLEAEFEGYREFGAMTPRLEPPVRFRAVIDIHVGSSSPSMGAAR